MPFKPHAVSSLAELVPEKIASIAIFRTYLSTDNLHFSYTLRAFLSAICVHYAKEWSEPQYAMIFFIILLLSMINLREIVSVIFGCLVFVVINIPLFPRLANHTSLSLFIAVFLLGLACYAVKKRKQFFAVLTMNNIKGVAIVLYFFVGFHKINTDFLNADISCATWFHDKVGRTFVFFNIDVPEIIIRISPLYVVLTELLAALALSFRRFWFIGFICAAPVHLYVALSGFTDFSILGHALLIAFLPEKIWDSAKRDIVIRKKILRHIAIYFVTVIIYVLVSLHLHFFVNVDRYLVSSVLGLITIAAYFDLFALSWLAVTKQDINRSSVQSMLCVPLEYKNMVLPALIFMWCLFPYLFGAQASLTMFSNLVTEKERSNHLLIDTRYTKIRDFEKDLVFIENIPTIYRPPSRYDLQGYLIPLSEFKFIASVTTQDPDRRVSIKGQINEEQVWIKDLAHSEFASAPLVSRFMSFRQIDPAGPAKCRW